MYNDLTDADCTSLSPVTINFNIIKCTLQTIVIVYILYLPTFRNRLRVAVLYGLKTKLPITMFVMKYRYRRCYFSIVIMIF